MPKLVHCSLTHLLSVENFGTFSWLDVQVPGAYLLATHFQGLFISFFTFEQAVRVAEATTSVLVLRELDVTQIRAVEELTKLLFSCLVGQATDEEL